MQSITYYGKLQSEGKITSFEPCILGPHGGDLGGFFLLKGDSSKLDVIRRSDEFQTLVIRAGLNLTHVGVIDGYVGEGLQKAMNIYQNAVPRK